MYSYEHRVRAVVLYLKLGKRIKATIRQLGYPMISWGCAHSGIGTATRTPRTRKLLNCSRIALTTT